MLGVLLGILIWQFIKRWSNKLTTRIIETAKFRASLNRSKPPRQRSEERIRRLINRQLKGYRKKVQKESP
jgi:hypothetical protein